MERVTERTNELQSGVVPDLEELFYAASRVFPLLPAAVEPDWKKTARLTAWRWGWQTGFRHRRVRSLPLRRIQGSAGKPRKRGGFSAGSAARPLDGTETRPTLGDVKITLNRHVVPPDRREEIEALVHGNADDPQVEWADSPSPYAVIGVMAGDRGIIAARDCPAEKRLADLVNATPSRLGSLEDRIQAALAHAAPEDTEAESPDHKTAFGV